MALNNWFLAGTKLSPYNLSLTENYRVVGEDIETLSGALRRDIRSRKLECQFQWEYLPEHDTGSYHAYADLKAFGTTGTVALIRPTGTSADGTASYTVLCNPPEAELAFRDTGTVFWNVAFTVREA